MEEGGVGVPLPVGEGGLGSTQPPTAKIQTSISENITFPRTTYVVDKNDCSLLHIA